MLEYVPVITTVRVCSAITTRSMEGPPTMVPRVRSRTIHTHSTPTIPRVSIIMYHTQIRSSRSIGSSRPTSTHPAQLDPRHDGDGSHFARIRARADRDALGARAARYVDARCDDDGVRAFGIGRWKAVDARRRRRRRSTDRRSTEAGRGSDTRRRYAIGATRGMKTRSSRAR